MESCSKRRISLGWDELYQLRYCDHPKNQKPGDTIKRIVAHAAVPGAGTIVEQEWEASFWCKSPSTGSGQALRRLGLRGLGAPQKPSQDWTLMFCTKN